jgi:hypothetical protein
MTSCEQFTACLAVLNYGQFDFFSPASTAFLQAVQDSND